jgi:hypothetical protein
MTPKAGKTERVIYEEKPRCGRCGAGIVGVIPRRWDGKPLCRECAFELEEMAIKSRGHKVVFDDEKPAPSPEELQRRTILLCVLSVAVLILLFRIYTIAPLLSPPKPIRLGVKVTDSVTDRCIEQLWVLSRKLQDGNLPRIMPVCPLSSKEYIVRELANDTVISCPNPAGHGLESLSVSLKSPIPNAVAGDLQ